jgi:hypothetical protein
MFKKEKTMTIEMQKQRLEKIMGTFDLATGHADTFDELLDSLEFELRDVLGCSECGIGGGHALYCVRCAEKFVGGYKENVPVHTYELLTQVSTDTQYAGNGTAGIQNETKPTGFFFQIPKLENNVCI